MNNPQPRQQAGVFSGLPTPTPVSARTMTNLGQAYVRSIARWQEEMSRFMSDRFGKDAKAAHAAAACKDISALLSIQKEWANEMAADYLEQSTKMVAVAAEVGESVLAPLTAESGRGRASTDPA